MNLCDTCQSYGDSINRNIVECKYLYGFPVVCVCIVVLIETLWNVNDTSVSGVRYLLPVLIETLWNVNLVKWQLLICTVWVLIETLWNVNMALFTVPIAPLTVLIETLWNVNKNFALWLQ